MNKLLLNTLLLLPLATITMDAPSQNISYEGPQPAYNDNGYEINAKDGLYTVGWITYDYHARDAEISTLFVDKDDQHKGIGGTLFKKCIQHLVAQGCSRIYWTASAFANVGIEELRMIYSKLIQKLDNPDSYKLQTLDVIEGAVKKIKMILTVNKN